MSCSECHTPLRFTGIARTESAGSFGQLRCAGGHSAWRLGRIDVLEPGWRLTIPASRVDRQLNRFVPETDPWIADVASRFQRLPGHRAYRPGQRGMAITVALAWRDRSVALANTGAGIGKTIAYLLPALLWIHQPHGIFPKGPAGGARGLSSGHLTGGGTAIGGKADGTLPCKTRQLLKTDG